MSSSDGIFHDCAIHDLDFVCWILGEFPDSVFTQAHVHDEDIASMNDVDTVVIVMKFSSGVISIIELSRHATYGYDQRIEVITH
jgi:myo-inositol 2-dehydrogenase/D-chiro-inositol 1-dehydrogenase